jgi:hypothetical protein
LSALPKGLPKVTGKAPGKNPLFHDDTTMLNAVLKRVNPPGRFNDLGYNQNVLRIKIYKRRQ